MHHPSTQPPTAIPVTDALSQLLRRILPASPEAEPAAARLSIIGAGVDLPVALIGLGKSLLQVTRGAATEPPFLTAERVVLRIVLDEEGLRVDVPVEVASCGRVSMVLRILGVPLVLRRRMVRDRELEAALGGPRAGAPLVA
jgi:hypothetical protein